ncbi:MAG: Asp-tRNA(Asn)/Glu-tRNA(Gln) amidotransferase subunit GatA [Patescibacteria group bacterium]|jgi:aspartyl-tRNA(Asn)/glutamyl-tRNA(Gln) amidotransferase subunit A
MEWLTITDIREGLQKKLFSVSELTSTYLERIATLDSKINSFISVREEEVQAEADIADKRIREGKTRVLEGVPFAIKDNLMLKGGCTTAGSNILKDYSAVYTATAVQKLLDVGAIILGKTNMDEFAMGSSTEYSAFGPTKNPHDMSRVPGGSSGGSAAAIAADFCTAALGSDTGGSIRQPASFCGVVGFKPTYGRVSRYGLIAMSSSLDQIGPITKTVEDAALVYSIISGEDKCDPTSSTIKCGSVNLQKKSSLKGKRFGIPKSFVGFEIEKSVQAVFDRALADLRSAGAEICEIDIPLSRMSLAVYYLMVTSEISSNLARYDGIRYGTRVDVQDLIGQYIAARTQGFGEEAKRRILLGTFTLSKGYRDKYYKQALAVKEAIGAQFDKGLAGCDALISLTSPTSPFKLGEKFEDPLTMYLSDLFTVSANIANLPAISLPLLSEHLPVGFQMMGKRFGDAELLSLASACEDLFGKAQPAKSLKPVS